MDETWVRTTHEIESGDAVLHVREAGDPDGPPTLLVHGWPESGRAWAKVAPLLAHRRLIVPDLRGFGRSSMPEGTERYAMGVLVADVASILDALGVERADYVGHDFGAAIGWSVGTYIPDRIGRAVLACAPHPMRFHAVAGDVDQLRRSFYVWLMHIGPRGEAVLAARDFRILADFAFGRPPAVGADVLDAYRAEWAEPGRFHAMAELYRACYPPELLNPDVELALPPVRVPVRYVHAERDLAFVPAVATGSGAYVEAEHDEVTLAGVGHWVMHEAPQRLAALIDEWLSGSSGGSGPGHGPTLPAP